MPNSWYLKVGDKVVGPIDDAGLASAVAAGTVQQSSRIRLGEQGAWGPASLINGLFGAAPSPTIAPVEELPELHADLLAELPVTPQVAQPLMVDRTKSRSRASANSDRWKLAFFALGGVTLLLFLSIAVIWMMKSDSDADQSASGIVADSLTATPKSLTDRRSEQGPIATAPVPAPRSVKAGKTVTQNRSSVYLSDLKETLHEVWELHPGFGFGTNGKFLDGKDLRAITLGGKPSPKGILAHPKTNSASRVVYDLSGKKYKYFQGMVGVDDVRRYGPHTPLVFEVLGDDELLWQSQPVARWGEPQPFNIPLPDISELELRVRCPGDASFAFAIWCEPMLTNSRGSLPTNRRATPAESRTNTRPPGAAPKSSVVAAQKKGNEPERAIEQIVQTIVLPTGAVIDASQRTLIPAAIKALFTQGSASSSKKKATTKALAHFAVKNGLLTFNNEGELEGHTLVLSDDRKPMTIVSYENNRRDGVWRCWNDKGHIERFTTYKAGRKLGITLIYVNGQPRLIEDWGTNQVPSRYFVKLTKDGPSVGGVDNLDPESKQVLTAAEATLELTERRLLEDERQWRQSLRTWWSKNEAELKRLNQSLAAARDREGRGKWEREIRTKLGQLQNESDQARQEFLSRL